VQSPPDGPPLPAANAATKSAINFNDDFTSIFRYLLSAFDRSRSRLDHAALGTPLTVAFSRLTRRYSPWGTAYDCNTILCIGNSAICYKALLYQQLSHSTIHAFLFCLYPAVLVIGLFWFYSIVINFSHFFHHTLFCSGCCLRFTAITSIKANSKKHELNIDLDILSRKVYNSPKITYMLLYIIH